MAFKVLWVGGPPGKTFQKILDKLAADEIEVVDRQDQFAQIPTGIDAVLANIDMLGHSDFDAAKAEAKRAGVKFVAARLDYTRMRIALEGAGLVASGTKPVALEVTEAVEKLQAGSLDSAEAIRSLFQKLPLDLVRVALEEAQQKIEDAEREERLKLVTAALEAFRALRGAADQRAAYAEFASGLTEIEAADLDDALKPFIDGR